MPRAVLYVFILSLPFEYALAIRGPVTLAPPYLMSLALLAVFLLSPSTDRGTLRSPLTPLVAAYALISVLSLVMTIVLPPPDAPKLARLGARAGELRSVLQTAFLLLSVAVYFIVLFSLSTPDRLRWAVRLLVTMGALVSVYAVYQMLAVHQWLPWVGPFAAQYYDAPASLRPNGTFQEPMHLGHYLISVLPLAFALFIEHHQLESDDGRLYGWAVLPLIALMAIALMLTYSRGPWLAAACGIAAVVLLNPRRRLRSMILLVLALGVGAVAVAVFALGSFRALSDVLVQRFQFSGANVTNEQRLWYLPFLLSLFREYPWLGVGYGNYGLYQLRAFDLYGIAGGYGVYWQALVETGVLGLLSLLALVIGYVAIMRRAIVACRVAAWRPYLIGCLGSFIAVAVGHLFMGDRLNLYTWTLLAVSMAAVRQSRAEEPLP